METDVTDIFAMPVHPHCALFPMLDEDEMAGLAESIAEHGLRVPLTTAVVDGVEVLIDGKNRREACRLAGVVPAVERLEDGADLADFVISKNILRRHVSKGQRAMAEAMTYPEPMRLKRAETSPEIIHRTSKQLLSWARTVLAYSPEMARQVRDGTRALKEAYDITLEKRRAAQSESEKITAALAKLRKRFPLLADRVKDGELSLEGAIAEAAEREQRFDRLVAAFSDLSAAAQVSVVLPSLAESPRQRRQLRDMPGFEAIQKIVELLAETEASDDG